MTDDKEQETPAARCENCRFVRLAKTESNLECHRDPPTVHPVMVPPQGRVHAGAPPQLAWMSAYPPVPADQWCGEWEALAEESV